MNKQYKCGLYLGRFQPLHKGHVAIINRMLCDCEKVIIAVGSAQEEGTVRNPLSYEFRKHLIEETYCDFKDDIVIIPIRDRDKYSDDSSWGECLFKQISEQTNLRPGVIYEGDEDTNTHWYDNFDIKVVKVSRQHIPVSGTYVRSLFELNRKVYILEYLPLAIHKYYDEIRKEIQNGTAH